MGRAVYSLSTTHELCQLALIGQTALDQGFARDASKALRALCMKCIVQALQITNLNKPSPLRPQPLIRWGKISLNSCRTQRFRNEETHAISLIRKRTLPCAQ